LRKKQQIKVEELKKKTSYYLTKGLIERYETPTKISTKNEDELRKRIGNTAVPQNLQTPTKPIVGTPQQPYNSNRAVSQTPQRQPTIRPPNPVPSQNQSSTERTWLDRLMDAIVGEEEGPERRYALICEKCFAHNGLVKPEEYVDASNTSLLEFRCLKCEHLTVKQKVGDKSKFETLNVNSNNMDSPLDLKRLKVKDNERKPAATQIGDRKTESLEIEESIASPKDSPILEERKAVVEGVE
jgi:hypothetical protein